MNNRDVFADTWVATDDLGREIGTDYKEFDAEKKVGIFYLIWHDPIIHGGDGQIYNFSEAYEKGGVEGVYQTITEGPVGFAHYWAEPYLGYYRSDDEWVIRKHAEQLSNAGIDFIFLDNTNGITYKDTYEKIFKIYSQIRIEGGNTPQIAFWVTSDPQKNSIPMVDIYNNIYSVGRYKDLWFMWDDKPLMLCTGCNTEQPKVPDEILAFFTIKKSWANSNDSWYTDTDGKDCWIWSDMTPQGVGRDANGNVEQMPVMCGFWANGSYGTNAGRSYYKGKQPDTKGFGFDLLDTSAQGLAFSEQFEEALKVDPKVILITGWNEWWAGRWNNILPDGGNPAQGQTIGNTYIVDKDDPVKCNYYVDALSPEYSRDIEAMKGGFGDNFYWKMVDGIRKFKGVRKMPTLNCKLTINNFDDWDKISHKYMDNLFETKPRNCTSYVGGLTYVNDTGRNDFDFAKVAYDDEFYYFFVQTREDITKPQGTNWMNLFIDTDLSYETGWHGFDLLINRFQADGKASIEKYADNFNWKIIGWAEFRIEGKRFQLCLPCNLINRTFDFKWADNSVKDDSIMDFLDKGDTAPADKFRYRFCGK